MLFPPPWFSPPDPPFRGAPFLKGNPPGGKTHPGGTARLSFVFLSPPCTENAPSICRIRQPLNTFSAWVADTTPPLYQSPQPPHGSRAHRPHSVLSPECPTSCFGGQRRSATGSFLTRSPPLQGTPPAATNTKLYPPPPSRPRPDRSCGNSMPPHYRTNNPAPREAANCRHRPPLLWGCEPRPPLRRPTVPSAAVVISPPFKTEPTTTLGTKRNASGGNLEIPPWAFHPPGGGPVALGTAAARARESPAREGRGSIPIPLFTARAKPAAAIPTHHLISKPKPHLARKTPSPEMPAVTSAQACPHCGRRYAASRKKRFPPTSTGPHVDRRSLTPLQKRKPTVPSSHKWNPSHSLVRHRLRPCRTASNDPRIRSKPHPRHDAKRTSHLNRIDIGTPKQKKRDRYRRCVRSASELHSDAERRNETKSNQQPN